MSKMINVPGTTDFVPLDDIISIKIHGKLVSKEEVLIPQDSTTPFMVRVGTYAEFEVVTNYIGDTDEDEDEDEDEEDKPKGKKVVKKEEEAPKSEDKTARISWLELPLNTNPILTEIDQSLVYTELDEKTQGQVDLRVGKYIEYLKNREALSELQDKLANVSPEPVEESDEVVSGPALEEEDDSASVLDGITTLTPIVRTPDEIKLKEITDYLEDENNNEEKQAKRIEYLEKRFNKSVVELVSDDGFKFIQELKGHGLGTAEINELRSAVREIISEVSNLVG